MLAQCNGVASAARGLVRRLGNCHEYVTRTSLAVSLVVVLGARPLAAQRLPIATADTAQIVFDDDGLRIHSADGRRQLKLRGFVMLDTKVASSDRTDQIPNGFGIRFARLVVDANINPWIAVRLMPDLYVGTNPPMADAFMDFYFSKRWWMRVGKQKTVFSWERLQSETDMAFAERSLASSLSTNRDEGATLMGEFGQGRAELALGVFNGVPDGGANGDGDGNDAKDFEAKVTVRPMLRPGAQGWTVGMAATHGVMRAAGTATGLPKLNTIGLVPWFVYREAAGSIADGVRDRYDLFSYAHFGTFGAFAEMYREQQAVRRGTTLASVHTASYTGMLDWVLTGERSIQGGIAPAKRFDPEHGQWGAWQVTARMSEVSVGDEAFPVLADPTVAARRATEYGADLNWYFTRLTKAQFQVTTTAFHGGSTLGDRPTEQLFLLRLQAFF